MIKPEIYKIVLFFRFRFQVSLSQRLNFNVKKLKMKLERGTSSEFSKANKCQSNMIKSEEVF